jgi:hypothetical protein
MSVYRGERCPVKPCCTRVGLHQPAVSFNYFKWNIRSTAMRLLSLREMISDESSQLSFALDSSFALYFIAYHFYYNVIIIIIIIIIINSCPSVQSFKHYAIKMYESEVIASRHQVEVSCQLLTPTALPPGIGGCMEPITGMDTVERKRFLSLPAIQTAASRYAVLSGHGAEHYSRGHQLRSHSIVSLRFIYTRRFMWP